MLIYSPLVSREHHEDCSELTTSFVYLPTLYVVCDPQLRLHELEMTPELITCLVPVT